MPKIPQYVRQESIPAVAGNVMADPEAMSRPDLALAAVGKKVGDEYTDLFAQMQAKIDAAEVLKSLDDFRNEQRNYIREQRNIVGKNVIDVSNFTQSEADKGKDLTTRATEWHTKLADTYANNLQSDSQKDLFLGAVRSEIDQGLNSIASHQATQTRQFFVDQIDYTIDTAIKDIQENPSEDAVNRAKLRVATAVQALYPGQNVDEYKLHALNRIDTATKAIRENNIITQEIVGLKTKYAAQFPDDPQKALISAINEAESPEFIKRVGADKQQHIVASLSNAAVQEDRAYIINSRKVKDDFANRLLSPGLNARAFKAEVSASMLRPEDKLHYYSIVDAKQRADRAEARMARVEEKQRMNEARENARISASYAIRTGQITDEKDILTIIAKTGMTHTDYNDLMRVFDDTNATKGQVDYYQKAVDVVDATIGFTKDDKQDRDKVLKRNSYLKTLDYYMTQGKLKKNDPAILDLVNKLTAGESQWYNPFSWGDQSASERMFERNTLISPEELGFRIPQKTRR